MVASAISELAPEDTRKIAQNKLMSLQQSAQTLQEAHDEPPTKIVRIAPNETPSTSTTQPQFKCHTPQNALCYQAFPDLQSLRDHMATHEDIRYKCTQCEKNFNNELDLKNHQFNYR